MKKAFTVEIEKMAYGGRGMGRVNGKVVFVPFTAPGDRIQAEVVREKKNYVEAVPKTVEQESPLRGKPFCGLLKMRRLPISTYQLCPSIETERKRVERFPASPERNRKFRGPTGHSVSSRPGVPHSGAIEGRDGE